MLPADFFAGICVEDLVMADKRDYYEVLGVSKDADEAAIKKHTEFWLRNIILTPIPETKKLKQSSRKLLKLMLF